MRKTVRRTTVLLVRRDDQVALAADGQVSLGDTIIKNHARKIRRLHNDQVIAGFAGSTADAFSLFARFEGKLEEFRGNLRRASVELAQEWRTDRALRHLDAVLIVSDRQDSFLISGNGDVIEPDDGLIAVGSGGAYALAAARAMMRFTEQSAAETATEALRIASEICVYTNSEIMLETL
ncbi:MAG: ATP-dependent protease subunit HslV [Acidobacteriota bacterium]|jgi:ATP-dependent HslUV protease, peptidase subunit HslV